ncbi:MAG TPA: hypothetical protein VMF62_08325 [Acetobacteraceae bacterium]|nr:hypothetical protein [Acetobacteraceae bacterium]
MPDPVPEPKAPESQEPAKSAERLAAQLAQQGHPEHAHGLRRALALGAERAVLFALDETCQTLLSMVEGFDPETEGMIEQLRLSLDRRLKGGGPLLKPPAPR